MQESSPSLEVNTTRKDIHLAVLKQRLRERETRHLNRQKKIRRTGVVVAAFILVLVGGNVAELGSDGFDISIQGPASIPDNNLAVIGFRRDGMNVLEEDSPEIIEAFARLIGARNGIPLNASSYSVNEKEFWSIQFEYQVGNIKRNYSRGPDDRPSTTTREHLDFLVSESDLMLEQIEKGILQSVSSHTEIVDGVRFMFKTYHYQSKKYGLVVYKHGEPRL